MQLEHGDVYLGTAKAFGFDWKKRRKVTFRHAAGEKYVEMKRKAPEAHACNPKLVGRQTKEEAMLTHALLVLMHVLFHYYP